MEERHKLLYERLGYTGPLETGSQPLGAGVIADNLLTPVAVEDDASPLIDEAGAVLPDATLPGEDPAEIPPLGPEGVDQLEESLNRRPDETLIRAREAFDEDISETELRAMIAQARGSCIGHAGYPYDRQSVGKSTPAPLLFFETNPRFPKWTKLRQDRGNNGYCILSLKSDGSVGLQYEDWMAQRRCEASLTRTATGRLQVSSVVPVP